MNNLNEKSLEFNQYEIYLYSLSKNKFICNTKNINIWHSEENLSNKQSQNILSTDLTISNIIKNLMKIFTNSKNKNKDKIIYYNTIFINTIKISIVYVPPTNLIAVGVFSKETKSGIIRIFLLNMIISYINFKGDKDDFLKSKIYNELSINNINNDKKINEQDNINLINAINPKLYDTFLSIPIQMHFNRVIKKIFKRQTLYIKDIYYKNYYLIDIDNEKVILSLETLNDKNNGKDPVFKTSNQKAIWKELMLHCHNLKNDYIKKNNMIFDGMDYKNFFVKIEFKVTYPRRNFIIKFLPLFNGMCLIHEYIQNKLSTFDSDDKKNYNEKSILYGYEEYDNIFKNSDNRYFENEHHILKQVHFFFIEALFCSKGDISYFFTQRRKPKIYFSEEILEIIEKELIKYMNEENIENKKLNSEDENSKVSDYPNDIVINRIINTLYEEYIQLNTSKKNVIQKPSNLNKRKDILMKLIDSLDKKKSLQLSKSEALVYLFYSIQYNKNINPNDITIDLNDERISQMQLDNNNNEINNNITSSEISLKKMQNSLRLSELLSEKISMRPSKENGGGVTKRDSKFPYDTEIEEVKENSENNYDNININELDAPIKESEVEYNNGNNVYSNEQEKNDVSNNDNNNDLNKSGDNNINNNFDSNEIMNNDINYIINDDNNYQLEINNINSEHMSDINYQNNIITTNNNIDDYTYDINKINNDKYNNIKVKKLNSSQQSFKEKLIENSGIFDKENNPNDNM